MNINAKIGEVIYEVDLTDPVHISIPLLFNGAQPNTYDLPLAKAETYEGGGFVGDVRRGGGCNFETYQFTPHCNGTHTECIGHITGERFSVHEKLQDVLIPATMISVQPLKGDITGEHYAPELSADDEVITASMLDAELSSAKMDFMEALIIRTLPNTPEKKSRRYAEQPPAFFTLEAMQLIVDRGIQHLLTDLPSVDRALDEGKLSTHHIFWNIAQGSHEISAESHIQKTITEMVFIPDHVQDGAYLLNLQMAAFCSDASPSRPVLFHLTPQS